MRLKLFNLKMNVGMFASRGDCEDRIRWVIYFLKNTFCVLIFYLVAYFTSRSCSKVIGR